MNKSSLVALPFSKALVNVNKSLFNATKIKTYSFVLNRSRGWNKQGAGSIFLNFHELGVYNKIILGEDRKSTLKIGSGVKIK